MGADVECYSGSRYAEKPLAFFYDGKKHKVAAVVNEKLLEDGRCFNVRTDEDYHFQIFYDMTRDQWLVTRL